jgi:hypothetical protein
MKRMQYDSSSTGDSDNEPLSIMEKEIEIDEMVEILGFGWFQIRLLILLGTDLLFNDSINSQESTTSSLHWR